MTASQIELLEMRVEATIIQMTSGGHTTATNSKSKFHAWKELLQEKFRDRTLIGVLIMFFQRMELNFHLIIRISVLICPCRVVRYQRPFVLWSDPCGEDRTAR